MTSKSPWLSNFNLKHSINPWYIPWQSSHRWLTLVDERVNVDNPIDTKRLVRISFYLRLTSISHHSHHCYQAMASTMVVDETPIKIPILLLVESPLNPPFIVISTYLQIQPLDHRHPMIPYIFPSLTMIVDGWATSSWLSTSLCISIYHKSAINH